MSASFSPRVTMYPTATSSAKGQDTELRLILAGIKYGRWADFIARVRRCEYHSKAYDSAKSILPAFTPCGTFLPGTRLLDTLTTPSFVVSMDFDLKDNAVARVAWGRALLEHDAYTWAVADSCGGRGFFVLVRIGVNPAQHTDWFADLSDYYRLAYGLKADKGCGDVTRLRFISHDPDLYLSEGSAIYWPAPLLGHKPHVRSPAQLRLDREHADGIDSAYDVEACVREVERLRCDITAGNGRWVALGYALAGALGERGRSYFHRLSCFHRDYKPRATDRKYDDCLRKPSKVKLGKLFYLMREHSIEPVRRNSLAC